MGRCPLVVFAGYEYIASVEMKLTKKEFAHHFRQIFFTVVFLATSLSLIATFRSLVLIQQGINDFAHGYAVALLLAVFLGKIVVLAQKLPFIHALNHKPLIQSVFYKATVMLVIADIALQIEHKVFSHHQDQNVATVDHAVEMAVAHQLSLFSFSLYCSHFEISIASSVKYAFQAVLLIP